MFFSFHHIQVQFVITDEGGLTSGVFSLIVNVIRNQAPTISIPSLSYSINSNRPTNAVFATCQGFDPDTQVGCIAEYTCIYIFINTKLSFFFRLNYSFLLTLNLLRLSHEICETLVFNLVNRLF